MFLTGLFRLDGNAEGGYGRFVIVGDELINRRPRRRGLEFERQDAAHRQDAMAGADPQSRL